jgi:hypothetical protein
MLAQEKQALFRIGTVFYTDNLEKLFHTYRKERIEIILQ